MYSVYSSYILRLFCSCYLKQSWKARSNGSAESEDVSEDEYAEGPRAAKRMRQTVAARNVRNMASAGGASRRSRDELDLIALSGRPLTRHHAQHLEPVLRSGAGPRAGIPLGAAARALRARARGVPAARARARARERPDSERDRVAQRTRAASFPPRSRWPLRTRRPCRRSRTRHIRRAGRTSVGAQCTCRRAFSTRRLSLPPSPLSHAHSADAPQHMQAALRPLRRRARCV